MNITRTHSRASMAIVLSSWIALGAAGAYAGQGSGGKVQLRLKFRQGDVTRYKSDMTMAMSMAGIPGQQGAGGSRPMNTTSTAKQEVLRVLPDGSAEIRITTDAPAGAGGMFGQMGAGGKGGPMVAVSVMSPDGVMKSMKFEGPGGQAANSGMMGGLSKMFGGGGMASVRLPSHPVGPGDTWQFPINIPGVSTGSKSKSTFVKYGSYNGHRTAVIRTVTNMPLNINIGMMMGGSASSGQNLKGTVHVVSDTDIDIAAGKVDRGVGNGTMDMHMAMPAGQPGAPQMSGGFSMKMKMNMDMHIVP